MPKRTRSQLSRNSSQARAIKIRRHGESQSETENRLASQREYASQRLEEQNIRNVQARARESSSERSERLQNQRERQQTSTARVRNRVLAHSNRSASTYDPQIDYAQQSSVQIRTMNKICSKCSAKKWAD